MSHRCAGKRRALLLCALACGLGLPTAAAADLHLGAGAGGVVPWDSDADPGYSLLGQISGGGFGDRLRIGGELEYREYEVELLGVDDVSVDTYDLRLTLQFVFFPETLSPYVGAGAGLTLIDLDDKRVEDGLAAAGVDVEAFGVAAGAIAFAGVQLPLGSVFSLWTEARTSIAFDVTGDGNEDLNPSDLGAFTGAAGVRLSF
ncbi:MAG: porin family protein [Proteobacteria bacterium]|nr:porin family protein [Pseudomonadota bacterium]